MEKEVRERRFALSLSQHNIWDLECIIPGTSVNNISTTIRIRGRVDMVALQESIYRVLETDASLRTRLTLEDGVPVQYHAPFFREDFPVYDFSGSGGQGLESWEKAVTRETIPLTGGPLYRFILFRTGENSGGVLVKLHHIISDGWSQVMVCNKIGQTYLALLAGKEPELPEAPDYELHVEEEQEYLSSRAYKKDEEYWRTILQKAGEPSVLKSVSSAAVSPVGRRVSYDLPQVLNHAIYSFCLEKRVAPFAVFYMALAIYFKRIGGADRFTIGVPIFNRTNFQFKQSTGMFVTTLPFYNEIDEGWTLNEFNEQLMEAWYEMLRHQRFPFSHIEKLAGREGRLFNIALSYQDSKIFESRDASVLLSGRWHYSGYQMEQLCIHLTNLMDNKCYSVDYDYLTQFFAEEEIRKLHESLCGILMEALSEPDKPIYRLDVLTAGERERVLYTFNRTDRFLQDRSVYEALEENAAEYPDRAAVICGGRRSSYSELLWRATEISGALLPYKNENETLAAILLPRGFELLASMAGVLRAGCAYLILSPSYPDGRLSRILEKSGAAVLLTDEAGAGRLANAGIPVILTESTRGAIGAGIRGDVGERLRRLAEEGPRKEEKAGDRLAYVVYTSGSTGEPKGVEITQRNLLNLAQSMAPVYGKGAVLSVCNVGFDAFMLESIVALLNGRTIVLPAEEELESPRRLATLIGSYGVGFISLTPSRLSAFLNDDGFARAMRRMESVVCGGEAFPADLLKKLKNVSHARIYNQYGPSETTVGVSIGELSDAGRITAGRPMDNCRLYVLDAWMNPLPVGVYGNLYVGGLCVGRGYRNRPDLTGEVFVPSPFENGERLYATGDMACWTAEGEIVLAGRRDSQVKLRGLRVEPQEAAACIAAYPGVTAAAARVTELEGQPVLAVYYCSEEPIPERELLAHAATYLPTYMIPSFVMRIPEIPRGQNGKVDEKRLPLPEKRGGGTAVGTGLVVLDIFKKVLNRGDLGADSDYFLSGGNSLNAMETIAKIEEALNRRLRVADLYACRTAARLGALLDGEEAGAVPVRRLEKAPLLSRYPLSPMQQGIYVQCFLDKSGLSYNMPGAFRLKKAPDKKRLEQAFLEVIRKDAAFRTYFAQEPDGIFVHIADQVSFGIEELEAADFEAAGVAFLRPFDLAKAPLLRAALWKEPDGDWVLFLDSHHIIGDGMSTPIVLERLKKAYGGESLPESLGYQDYSYALQSRSGAGREGCLEYWKEHLKSLPEPLELPGDFTRQKHFDFKGKEYGFVLSEKESGAIREYCHREGVSSFALFLAAYGILLSAVSGREDFTVGAPVAGRTMPGTEEICGPFINTLPLRLSPEKELRSSDWIKEVSGEVAGLLDHQEVSLEELLSALELPRGEQNLLYQVMLTESPVDEEAFELDGAPMEFRPVPTGSVKMDLILEASRKGPCFQFRFSYATGLFLDETIRYYGRCLRQILSELVSGQDKALKDIRLLSPEDYEKYVEAPNYRVVPFTNLPIHRMVENRVRRTPEQAAVIFHGEETSFLALHRRACRIAAFLREQGLEKGSAVGLCLSRTPDMLAAMLGVLKAGCAYVFMLPGFPAARLSYMLEISKAGLFLYDEEAGKKLPDDFLSGELPCPASLLPQGEADSFEDAAVSGDDLVNVLFTSGSTGKPKGVMLRHRSISNLYGQMRDLLANIPGRVLCSTNSVFDCFVVETMIALALGRTVVLADEEEMMLPWKLADLVSRYHTGIFEMTPSRLQMCLGNEAFFEAAKEIRIVLLGGEVLTRTLLDQFYRASGGIMMNMYGPTEATVFTTMAAVGPEDHITVGAPLYNTRTYVLDEERRPVMPTAVGELYIAGECLSAGYISRPELTEASFVPDIYFPGERMYKSGDLVRLRLDGTYDFMGRRDSQVKLNGQRVELGEITGAVLSSGQALRAATLPIRKDDGSMELWCFYEPAAGADAEKLSGELKKTLPAYMIPSRMVSMEKLPETATGKIDLQALKRAALEGLSHVAKEPAAAVSAAAAPAPVNAPEPAPGAPEVNTPAPVKAPEPAVNAPAPEKAPEPAAIVPAVNTSAPAKASEPAAGAPAPKVSVSYVLEVWNRVLTTPAKDPDVSFFEQGGTSLGALSILSSYFNDKLEMSLADFYEHPTAREQAVLLGGEAALASPEAEPEEKTDDAPRRDAFAAQVYPPRPAKEGQRYVLVTGATGFFGIHLVKALLDQGEKKILCLLRDGSQERLMDCLAWYFGKGAAMREKKRLEAVTGDISKERLGLSLEEYESLSLRVREIFHCAADVRHYAADTEDFLDANVAGTARMVELAKKAGAAFYHMSTLSVSGELLKNGGEKAVFTEADYDIGQIWENNLYVKSKFQAEGIVFKAMDEGLPAKIFRLGRLIGRSDDGIFQKNPDTNAFYLLMRGFYLVGAIPELTKKVKVELMPVDIAAAEVLALKDSGGRVFHIMNPDPPTAETAAKAVDEGTYVVPDEVFTQMLSETAKGPYRELLSPLIDYWHRVRVETPVIDVTCAMTQRALEEKGVHIKFPPVRQLLGGFTLLDSWPAKGGEQ